jgi:hypothetical protein
MKTPNIIFKKILLTALFAFMAAGGAAAQETLFVNLTSNYTRPYVLDGVRRLTFTDNALVVHKTDGAQAQTDFTAVRNLTFVRYWQNEPTDVETITQTEIGVYPNPVTDELRIANYELHNGKTIDIFDISGRLVIQANTATVNVSTLSSGIYFVKINNQTIKIIKQ